MFNLIWLLLTLSACAKPQPLDCTRMDLQKVARCSEPNRAKGESASLVACLPFSEPVTTRGIWVVGFEKNDFFEGGPTPPPDVMWNESTGASLIVDEKVREKIARSGPRFYALEVDVVGRRALCPWGVLDPYPIAVENLKIRRRIGLR